MGQLRRLLRDPRLLWREHRRVSIGLAVALVAVAAGAFVAYQQLKRPADIHNPDVAFTPQKPKKAKLRTVNWPMYGYDRARSRYLASKRVRPPFRKIWRYTGRPLLEFPPTVAAGRLFFVDNNGRAISLDADTGRLIWKRRIGRLNASSPTYARGRLYVVNLTPGHVVKLHARTGRTLWKRRLPGRAESSPVVVGQTIYFGCENGQLFALSTRNGNVRWRTNLSGPIKAAPAYYRGTIYVGDYGGVMNAVDAKSGRLLWRSDSLGQGFGRSGSFYSTPAVAFGRVYAGSTDGRVYSFDRKTGTIAWTHSTGGYVYSGPAVASTRRSPPTVYIGSFDGNVYALDAKSGEPRWVRSAGGQVIGSLTAIGEIVYVAEFTDTSTTGFSMRNGNVVFRYPRGTYTPVVSDGRRLYLVGYSSITALDPYRYRLDVGKGLAAPPRAREHPVERWRAKVRQRRAAASRNP